MKIKSLVASILMCCALPAVNAVAADFTPGAYILGGVGRSNFDMNYSDQVRSAYAGSGFAVQSASLNGSTDTGYQIGGGYQFLPWLGVELTYVDLGRQDANYAVVQGGSAVASTRSANYKIDGFNLSAVGSFPVSNAFSILGKVGAFQSRLRYSESGVNATGGSASFSAPSDRQTKVSFGIGAEYRATDKISVRANWDRFRDIGSDFRLTETENGRFGHVDLYSINVLYRF